MIFVSSLLFFDRFANKGKRPMLILSHSAAESSLKISRGRFGEVHCAVQVHELMDLNPIKTSLSIRLKREIDFCQFPETKI